MANPKYTDRKLAVVVSSDFMIQPAHDTPIDVANLDYRHPQTTRQTHNIVAFREAERSCDGKYIVIEELTGKIARFTIVFSATAKFAAGWFAMLQGVAALPTGTPANETQTLNLNGATAGTFKLKMVHEGLEGATAIIAASAALTAASVQSAYEAIRPIKSGNVSVSGDDGGPFTIEYTGRLANANMPLAEVIDDTTSGGSGVTIAAGTNGANKLHLISRTASETPVQFSVVEGFVGETDGIKRYKNLVLDSWTASLNRRGKLALTIVAYGSPTPEVLAGFSIPNCVNPTPVKAMDTRVVVGGVYLGGDLRELTLGESNNIDVSDEAILWDDAEPDQLIAGDPTFNFSALIAGSPTSPLYAFADDENNAFDDLAVHFGRPGERFSYFADNAQFRLDDGLTEFVGPRAVSAFRLIGRPSPDAAGIASYAQYHGAHATQFLLSS